MAPAGGHEVDDGACGEAAAGSWPGEEILTRALAARSPGRLWRCTLPAPAAPLERLWEVWPRADAVLWDPPNGAALAGVGCALELAASGEERFRTLENALNELARQVDDVSAHGLARDPLALVGGLAFAPGGADAEPWRGLGDACFLLPRWSYRCDAGKARVTLALSPVQRAEPDALVQEYRHLCRTLARGDQGLPQRDAVAVREIPTPQQWERVVEQARARIRTGELAKVVLARRLVVTSSTPLEPAVLLAHLAGQEGGQYRFGLRRGGKALLGASPELLVARWGATVRSEALAGSAVLGRDHDLPAAPLRSLVEDPKQLEEHRLVVEAIAEVLAQLCESLQYPPQPTVRVLRQLAHLSTPFVGQLNAPLSVLELACRLHPTPAVGGVPRAAALDLMTQLEEIPRGWFAAPVGVLVPGGEGELAVALRCALVVGGEAHVYAGAGIVAASDPPAEVEESAAKGWAALLALGLAP